MTTIQVSSVPALAIPHGMIQITQGTRTGKTKEVIEPANKSRSIIINEFDVSGLPSKFTEFVRVQLTSTAQSQLKDLWQQHGNSWTETDAALWTTDAVLLYAARKSESLRLTTESVKAAFTAFVESFEKSKHEKMFTALCSMAASKKDCTIAQAKFLLAEIPKWEEKQSAADEEYDTSPLIPVVLRKLQEHVTAVEEMLASVNEAF